MQTVKFRVFKTRNKTIIYSAMFSMFVGMMLLSMSEQTISSAGAFSLSSYYDLNSIDAAIDSHSHSIASNWASIKSDNIYAEDSSLKDSGYHFLVCNGQIGSDGQIISTELWHEQLSSLSESNYAPTIRVGLIIADDSSRPTEVQIKRTDILAGTLSRKFNIPVRSISVPSF